MTDFGFIRGNSRNLLVLANQEERFAAEVSVSALICRDFRVAGMSASNLKSLIAAEQEFRAETLNAPGSLDIELGDHAGS